MIHDHPYHMLGLPQQERGRCLPNTLIPSAHIGRPTRKSVGHAMSSAWVSLVRLCGGLGKGRHWSNWVASTGSAVLRSPHAGFGSVKGEERGWGSCCLASEGAGVATRWDPGDVEEAMECWERCSTAVEFLLCCPRRYLVEECTSCCVCGAAGPPSQYINIVAPVNTTNSQQHFG